MTNQEALEILDTAAANYRGTRTDHVKLQEALELLRSAASVEEKADHIED